MHKKIYIYIKRYNIYIYKRNKQNMAIYIQKSIKLKKYIKIYLIKSRWKQDIYKKNLCIKNESKN